MLGVVHGYEFDADKVSVREVFLEASQQPGVCDLEVRRVPIESIVAELYKKWR